MRIFEKTCPACQTDFEAKRRNQLYCSPECRADVNNDKLKAKFNTIRTLEKDKKTGDKFIHAFLTAIRVVEVDYEQRGDFIFFEGRKFERVVPNPEPLRALGVYLGDNSVKGDKRIAIYMPQEGLLCFNSSDSYSAVTLTFRLAKPKNQS
jgi:hypothetical protein